MLTMLTVIRPRWPRSPWMRPRWPPEGGPKQLLAILVLVEPSERFPEAREALTGALKRHVASGPQDNMNMLPAGTAKCWNMLTC